MRKFTAILGMAAIAGSLTFSEAAMAFQTTSTPPSGGTNTAPAKGVSKAATQPASGNSQTTSAQPKAQAAAKSVVANATPAQIADAKAKGMVWVNTSSKVYHTADSKYYGATAHGQFMTEADAQKAGARAAKGSAK
jgi:hypothetical protein